MIKGLLIGRFESYTIRRYGAWNEYAVTAWQHLGRTVYNFIGKQKIRGHYVITRRPSLNISPWVNSLIITIDL